MESFCRSNEGKSEGLLIVTVVFDAVSDWEAVVSKIYSEDLNECALRRYRPLFSAPQQSQCRMFLTLPFETGKRLPQSEQKTKDPIVAMLIRNRSSNETRSKKDFTR